MVEDWRLEITPADSHYTHRLYYGDKLVANIIDTERGEEVVKLLHEGEIRVLQKQAAADNLRNRKKGETS